MPPSFDITPKVKRRMVLYTFIGTTVFALVGMALDPDPAFRKIPVYGLVILGVLMVIMQAFIMRPDWFRSDTTQMGFILAALFYGYHETTVHARHYDMEYFKAVAALFPVLFLAFIVEQKPNFREKYRETERMVALFLGLGQILGCAYTFDVLADNKPNDQYPPIINAVLLATTVYLVLSLATTSRAEAATSSEPE